MMTNVLVRIEDDELAELKKLMRVDLSATAVLSAARLGAQVERDRWIEREYAASAESAE